VPAWPVVPAVPVWDGLRRGFDSSQATAARTATHDNKITVFLMTYLSPQDWTPTLALQTLSAPYFEAAP
jgi:hypothetical protein